MEIDTSKMKIFLDLGLTGIEHIDVSNIISYIPKKDDVIIFGHDLDTCFFIKDGKWIFSKTDWPSPTDIPDDHIIYDILGEAFTVDSVIHHFFNINEDGIHDITLLLSVHER